MAKTAKAPGPTTRPAPFAATAPPPAGRAWPAYPGPSGLLKAARILLLVGAILAAVGAFLVLAMSLVLGAVFAEVEDPAEEAGAPAGAIFGFLLGFYGLFGVLSLAGSACGFVAWRKAERGDLSPAFVWGLVASLLPPVNIILLLGAIFCKTCPEADAQARAAAGPGWTPPQAR